MSYALLYYSPSSPCSMSALRLMQSAVKQLLVEMAERGMLVHDRVAKSAAPHWIQKYDLDEVPYLTHPTQCFDFASLT